MVVGRCDREDNMMRPIAKVDNLAKDSEGSLSVGGGPEIRLHVDGGG